MTHATLGSSLCPVRNWCWYSHTRLAEQVAILALTESNLFQRDEETDDIGNTSERAVRAVT